VATLEESPRRKAPGEEKESRLRVFLQRNDQMIRSWQQEEKREKAKFKSRLKLAALSPHKSLDKLKKQEKSPIKNMQKSTLFPSHKNLQARGGKGGSDRLQTV
jgi:hypothetical protein